MRTILLAAALVLTPLNAFAAEPQSIKVKVSDADLKSEETLGALLSRIEIAADAVCKHRPSPLAAGSRTLCKRDAVRDAISDAKIEALTVYYASVQAPAPREMSATLASR